MHSSSSFATFGDVTIGWAASPDRTAYRVTAAWRDQEFLEVRLDSRKRSEPFRVEVPLGDSQTGTVSGTVEVRGVPPLSLYLSLDYPGGRIVGRRLAPDGPPPPPPPGPSRGRPVASRIEAEPAELFPYLFVRPRPRLPITEVERRFVLFTPPPCPEAPAETGNLYCDLLAARREGRSVMEGLATRYLGGASPYEGQTLRDVAELDGPIRWFGEADRRLRRLEQPTLGELQRTVARLTDRSWPEVVAWILDPAGPFPVEKERVWQNVFARVVVLGWQVELLDQLLETLAMSALVERIAATEPDPAEGGPTAGGVEDEDADDSGAPRPVPLRLLWTPETIRAGLRATSVLPAGVFPLPAEASDPAVDPGAPTGGDRIEPFAVGELRQVRQRLTGYELGEVSAIENVLQGEHKETTRRRLVRRNSESRAETRSDDEARVEQRGARSDLTTTASEVLTEAFQGRYSTQYGPPAEGNVSGDFALGPTGEDTPNRARREEAARTAREIAAKTVRRLREVVARRRSESLLREDEETVVHRFDGTSSPGNVVGVYRWVDRVVELSVVEVGRRLLLEILVERPGRSFVRREAELSGLSFERPTSPGELGLTSPTDIATEPEDPLFWARLVARYDARGVQPPPAARRTLSAVVEGRPGPLGQPLVLPSGYRARRGWITPGWRADTTDLVVTGVLGRSGFRLSAAQPASPTSSRTEPPGSALDLHDEEGELVLALTSIVGAETGVRPAVGSPSDGPAFVLAVEVEAELGPQPLEEWQVATYEAILEGFERQSRRFYALADAPATGPGAVPPARLRRIERRELRRDVEARLLDTVRALLGGGMETEQLRLGEPRYRQLFDETFEWAEMSYSLQLETGEPPEWTAAGHRLARRWNADETFSAFLQARSARILLPVTPRFERRTAFLLASGEIWPGADPLTPAFPDQLALFDELDRAGATGPSVEPPCPDAWQVRVPTSMVWLTGTSELPDAGLPAGVPPFSSPPSPTASPPPPGEREAPEEAR